MAIGPFLNAVIALDSATRIKYDLDSIEGRKAVAELLMMEDISEEDLEDDGIFFAEMDAYCEDWMEGNAINGGVDVYHINSVKTRKSRY